MAYKLGVKDEVLVHLERGDLLHDVGEIASLNSILLKKVILLAVERIEKKRHPQIGHDTLHNIEFVEPAADIVLCYQKRRGGNEYSNGLAGKAFYWEAIITAVVDALDAMTIDRPYRKALSSDASLNEILSCSGTHFDSHNVDAFDATPPDVWMSIHNSVKKMYHYNNYCDLLCMTSSSSL